MEDCNSNTPTGASDQIGGQQGGSYTDAIARRTRAARDWVTTGDTEARNQAIGAHTEAAAHPEHRP